MPEREETAGSPQTARHSTARPRRSPRLSRGRKSDQTSASDSALELGDSLRPYYLIASVLSSTKRFRILEDGTTVFHWHHGFSPVLQGGGSKEPFKRLFACVV